MVDIDGLVLLTHTWPSDIAVIKGVVSVHEATGLAGCSVN